MLALARREREYASVVPAWQESLADQVEELIRRANGDAWPLSRQQWRNVAREYGLEVYLSRKPMLWEGLQLGTMVLVRDRPEKWITYRTICHEVAHALLESGRCPEFRGYVTAHAIARQVDTAYGEFLVFVKAGEEWAERRRWERREARERVGAVEITYERDEYADSPHFDD